VAKTAIDPSPAKPHLSAAGEPDDHLVAEEQVASASEFSGPLEWYWHFSQRADFETDPAQLAVLEQLQRLHDKLVSYKAYRAGPINRVMTNMGRGKRPPRGMYIWGSVGRGKSLLMDAFFNVVPLVRKRRIHFHEFMRWAHGEMRNLIGTEDPLDVISTQVAKKLRLLCFDEFHVSDIADAMILGRLLDFLTEKGVVIVLTSNYRPDDLYPNGLQRERFMPAIEILKSRLDVVEIAGKTDHRRRILENMQVYHVPPGPEADAKLAEAFESLSRARYTENDVITIADRPFNYLRRAKGVVWFDYKELCVKPRSQVDFLEIASHYHTVIVSGIPQLNAQSQSDQVRRLTWMVDIFYDTKVKLIVSAEEEPELLVLDPRGVRYETGAARNSQDEGGDLTQLVSAEFARTASRLREMQSKEYFAMKHASAEEPKILEMTN
jgi:cell division protein ZapE